MKEDRIRRVVMVCTGNTCRSPMAELLMRRALASRGLSGIEVASAGVFAFEGQPASRQAVQVMAEYGLDLSAHRSRQLSWDLARDALVLAMGESHRQAAEEVGGAQRVMLLLAAAGLPGEVEDPYGRGLEAYRQVADQLERAVALIAGRWAEGER